MIKITVVVALTGMLQISDAKYCVYVHKGNVYSKQVKDFKKCPSAVKLTGKDLKQWML